LAAAPFLAAVAFVVLGAAFFAPAVVLASVEPVDFLAAAVAAAPVSFFVDFFGEEAADDEEAEEESVESVDFLAEEEADFLIVFFDSSDSLYDALTLTSFFDSTPFFNARRR